MKNCSDMRRRAHKLANKWFWALVGLGAAMYPLWLASALIVEPATFFSDWESEEWGAALLGSALIEAATAVPYLIYASAIRDLIRRRWEDPSRVLHGAWGGAIGITIPFGGFWLMAIAINFTHEGGIGQGIVLLPFLVPVGLLLAVIGYFLGVAAWKLFVSQRQRPR